MDTTEEKTMPSVAKAPEGLLEEYKVLKSEILQTQGQRMQIISLTVGAISVLLSLVGGLVLVSETIQSERRLLVAVGGAMAIYTILMPSLIMMISTQQAIQRIGGYIRLFIEPKVPGLKWEHHWQGIRSKLSYKQGLGGLGAIYYFLSILPLLLPVYALVQYVQGWPIFLILIPFIIWSFYKSYDLQAGVSKGWKKARWED